MHINHQFVYKSYDNINAWGNTDIEQMVQSARAPGPA